MMPETIPIPIPGGLHGPLPKFVKVAQAFRTDVLESIEATVASEFAKFSHVDLSGKTVAIGVGSRGIKQLPQVVKSLIGELKAAGAKPFLIPAMGSHGGGSAEGQEKVLTSYGYTEGTMGVPVKSSLDVVELARIDPDIPVYCDKHAFGADYMIMCNRVKPHTDFRAVHESGLIKMLAIGMSKHAGATALHFHGMGKFDDLLPRAAEAFLANTKTLFGVAVVENAEEDVRHLEFVAPKDFFVRDAAMLADAKASIPRLLFEGIDVLLVDEIGKNISGAGMDPNVTGRTTSGEGGFDDGPPISRIVIRDLTDVTEGNATGLGMGDVITQRAVRKIDWTKVYVNIVTAGVMEGAKLPLVADNDRDAIGIAIRGCPGVHSETARIVRIKNTLEMTTVWASEPMVPEIEANPKQEILGEAFEMRFDNHNAITGAVM